MLEVTIYSCFSTITKHDDDTIVLTQEGVEELCTQIIDVMSKVAIMSPKILEMDYARVLDIAESRGIDVKKDYLPYTKAMLDLAKMREKHVKLF